MGEQYPGREPVRIGKVLSEVPFPVLSPSLEGADPWMVLGAVAALVASGEPVDVIAWNAAVSAGVEARVDMERAVAKAVEQARQIEADAMQSLRNTLGGVS